MLTDPKDRFLCEAWDDGAAVVNIATALRCSVKQVGIRRWQLRLPDRDRHRMTISGVTHPFDWDDTGQLT